MIPDLVRKMRKVMLDNTTLLFLLDLGCTALSANNPMYGIDVCNDELNTRECFYDNGGFHLLLFV